MQRNANIEQTSEMNKDFFVISQRVKQIFAAYCKYAKNSKKVRFCVSVKLINSLLDTLYFTVSIIRDNMVLHKQRQLIEVH